MLIGAFRILVKGEILASMNSVWTHTLKFFLIIKIKLII